MVVVAEVLLFKEKLEKAGRGGFAVVPTATPLMVSSGAMSTSIVYRILYGFRHGLSSC